MIMVYLNIWIIARRAVRCTFTISSSSGTCRCHVWYIWIRSRLVVITASKAKESGSLPSSSHERGTMPALVFSVLLVLIFENCMYLTLYRYGGKHLVNIDYLWFYLNISKCWSLWSASRPFRERRRRCEHFIFALTDHHLTQMFWEM